MARGLTGDGAAFLAEPRGAFSYEVIAAARAVLDQVVQDITREVIRDVPEYAHADDEAYARRVRIGVERVLHNFAERESEGWSGPSIDIVFAEIGRAEARDGRSLDALRAAMHRGVRIMWRQLSERLIETGASRETLCLAADSVLRYFEENANAAAEGHHEAMSPLDGQLQRSRRRLLDLLLSRPPAAPDALAVLAAGARWPIPRNVAAVIVRESGREIASRMLPPDILISLHRQETCLIVPDPDGPRRRRLLERVLDGLPAAVGPTVPPTSAAKSSRWARKALGLADRGMIATGGLIVCAEHMSVLMLLQDEEMAESLVVSRLAPLADLRAGQQDRLAETTLAWIQTANNVSEVASRLHVHPQTVRYRLRQVIELFGDQLHDPDARFELEIALRARRLFSADHEGAARVIALPTPDAGPDPDSEPGPAVPPG